MEYPVVRVRRRDVTGKGAARKLRALGYIPAVLYGRGVDSIPLVVNPKEVIGAFRGTRGANAVVRLEFVGDGSGEDCLAMVREYAAHPVRRNLLHCDFLRVSEDSEVTVEVPIRLVGKSEGERLGAKVSNPLSRVKVRCRVQDIPSAIEVDVTRMGVGGEILLSEVLPPPGVTLVYTKDVPVVLVRMGRAEKESAAAAEGPSGPGEGGSAAGASSTSASKSS